MTRDLDNDKEPGKIDRTAARLTNLTVMARLLTTEELLGLRKIITKELLARPDYMRKKILGTIETPIPEEMSTTKERCHEEAVIESSPHAIQRIKDEILEAKKEMRGYGFRKSGEQMDFPNTFDEFAKDYGFKDKDEVYTNGSELIPVFRVKQWLEHISATKNNTVDFNKINELADFAIKATGQRDSYLQGMCNGIEYLRATLTDTKPKYFESEDI